LQRLLISPCSDAGIQSGLGSGTATGGWLFLELWVTDGKNKENLFPLILLQLGIGTHTMLILLKY
jgi:hypothetical protein